MIFGQQRENAQKFPCQITSRDSRPFVRTFERYRFCKHPLDRILLVLSLTPSMRTLVDMDTPGSVMKQKYRGIS
jgi:hypothetical protein